MTFIGCFNKSDYVHEHGRNTEGGAMMSSMTKKKPTLRDYSKPIIPVFRGKNGYRAYVEIATTPPTRYNAEAEKQKAADNLRKQGLMV